MRTGTTITRGYGAKKFVLLFGPETPLADQTEVMREILGRNCIHEEYEEIQFWQSDCGVYRTLKCRSAKAAKVAEAMRAKQQKFHEESQKALLAKPATIAAAKLTTPATTAPPAPPAPAPEHPTL